MQSSGVISQRSSFTWQPKAKLASALLDISTDLVDGSDEHRTGIYISAGPDRRPGTGWQANYSQTLKARSARSKSRGDYNGRLSHACATTTEWRARLRKGDLCVRSQTAALARFGSDVRRSAY